MESYLSIDIVFLFMAAVSFALTAVFVATRRRQRPTWKAGFVLLLACAELNFSQAMQGLFSEPGVKVFWYILSQVGFAVAPTAFLILAMRYSGLVRYLTFWGRLLLCVFPAITVILFASNHLHGWVMDPNRIAEVAAARILFEVSASGFWYWLFLAHSYLVMGVGCWILARMWFYSRRIYGWQVGAVLAAVALSLTGISFDILRWSPLPPFTLSALGMAIGGFAVAYLLSPLQKQDLLSVTRSAILESLWDGILVVDADGLIADANPAAEKIIQLSAKEALGKSLAVLLPELGIPDSITESREDLQFERGASQRSYSGRVSIIRDWNRRVAGRVIVLRDITEQRQVDSELIAQRRKESHFSAQLTVLVDVTNRLSKTPSVDAFCRMAVEEGCRLLGYDRMAIWFISGDRREMYGSFGTDTDGRTTDERPFRHPLDRSSRLWSVIEGRQPLIHVDGALLYRADGQQVGVGARVNAGLWDGDVVIGFLSVDNLRTGREFTENDFEIIRLYASTLGHLCTLKRAEGKLLSLARELDFRVEERTEQLEAANRELEAFTYSVSHDLRAPLRRINGFSQALLEDLRPEPMDDAGRNLARIREAGDQMRRLIEDLLAFSRFSRQPLRKQKVDMATLVRRIVEEQLAEPVNANRKITLVWKELPDGEADPVLIAQVWSNLISNAIKYTRPCAEAKIEIGHRVEGGQTVYYVKDNGVGFDMQYSEKLFGVFQRLHREEEFEGTGAGLAIVYRIIQRHGGRVWGVGAEGAGAVFFFTLNNVAPTWSFAGAIPWADE